MPYKRTGRTPGRPKKAPPEKGKRPTLSAKQWKALRYEMKKPRASLSQVASVADVSRQCVHQWRSDPHYREGREWLKNRAIVTEAVPEVVRLLRQGNAELAEQKKQDVLKKIGSWEYTIELLAWDLERQWTGSVVSPFDRQTYTDKAAYLEHIRSWRSSDGTRPLYMGHVGWNLPIKEE